jgi:hypothetical protein
MKRVVWTRLGFALFVVAGLLPTVRLVATGDFSSAGVVSGLLVAGVILFAVTQVVRARVRRAQTTFPDAYVCSVTVYSELGWEMRAAYPDAPKFLVNRAATVVVDGRGVRVLAGLRLRELVAIAASDITALDVETTMQNRWNLATVAVHVTTSTGENTVHLCLSRWNFAFARVLKGDQLNAALDSMRRHLGVTTGVG